MVNEWIFNSDRRINKGLRIPISNWYDNMTDFWVEMINKYNTSVLLRIVGQLSHEWIWLILSLRGLWSHVWKWPKSNYLIMFIFMLPRWRKKHSHGMERTVIRAKSGELLKEWCVSLEWNRDARRASLRFKKRQNFSINPRKLSIFPFFQLKWRPRYEIEIQPRGKWKEELRGKWTEKYRGKWQEESRGKRRGIQSERIPLLIPCQILPYPQYSLSFSFTILPLPNPPTLVPKKRSSTVTDKLPPKNMRNKTSHRKLLFPGQLLGKWKNPNYVVFTVSKNIRGIPGLSINGAVLLKNVHSCKKVPFIF